MLNAIKKAILSEAKEKKAKAVDFIKNGYDSDNTRGLRWHSTATRWDQFINGTITREQANEYAIQRAFKTIDKETEKTLTRVETIEKSAKIEAICVNVEWKRSSVWGYNPNVEVIARDKNGHITRTYGSASGCGYDKESAATGEALGQINGIMLDLCKLKNKALNKDKKATSNSAICYGAGYGIIPYFEGGVGFGCHEKMLNLCGFVMKNQAHSKYYTSYYFERETGRKARKRA